MKTSMISLTFILTTVLYGMPPAIAEPFKERGAAVIGPVASSSALPSTAGYEQPQERWAPIPSSFNDKFNYEAPGLSTQSAATLLGKHCDIQSVVGFNEGSPPTTC